MSSKNLSPYPEFISYGTQDIQDIDIKAVTETLSASHITQGPKINEFEKVLAEKVQAKYAVATNNGTAALHLACMSIGLTENDWLWTSPISFVASANCGLYANANVDFVDIDPLTRNISINALKKKLAIAETQRRLPKVLVVVHFAGLSADMKSIFSLSQAYGFSIIEDACHALGGYYQDKPVGCCEFSDFTAFSFHPVKPITTGEGGMLCSNDATLHEKAKTLATHGIRRSGESFKQASHGPWYYEMTTLGYNFRLTDFQAALGISQLDRLADYTQKRNELAQRYAIALKALPTRLAPFPKSNQDLCAFHLYAIELTEDAPIDRLTLYNRMRELNIGVNVHYIPIHLQPHYQKMGFKSGDFPNAENYYANCLTIPLFPNMNLDMQDFIISALKYELS